MIDRIKHILEQKNLTPSRFADQIGIPRSTISHILSGRNKPSLEVMQKIINAFPDIPMEWLIIGKGNFTEQTYTLFGTGNQSDKKPDPVKNEKSDDHLPDNDDIDESDIERNTQSIAEKIDKEPSSKKNETRPGTVEKLIILYTDGSFREYKPSV